jgi:hypothetical protein
MNPSSDLSTGGILDVISFKARPIFINAARLPELH